MKDVRIKLATTADVTKIEPIFSLYRTFYNMQKDSQSVIDFLIERLENKESTLLYAERNCVTQKKVSFV